MIHVWVVTSKTQLASGECNVDVEVYANDRLALEGMKAAIDECKHTQEDVQLDYEEHHHVVLRDKHNNYYQYTAEQQPVITK